ncbi:MAG: tyrosine--tRNA ligase [Spirochaetaceae bacterium]
MNIELEVQRQMGIITEGVAEIMPVKELEAKIKKSLETGIALKIKMGIDPTSPDVHLGHMTVYKKIRQFQDLGHHAHLIIGDYTARIGDPTGRNSERPPLTANDVENNAETYSQQIFKIVDRDKTTIHKQSDWFNKVDLQDLLTASSKFSVAHMLSHETFKKRLETGARLSLHELFYPVLQAWDSVQIECDVELGGMDQKFNILCGRDMLKDSGLEPQVALFMPLLLGSDGRKMSKSFNNHIPVLSKASDKFGRVMAIRDDIITTFFSYCTNFNQDQVLIIEERLKLENPRDLKLELASEIVSIYHSKKEADFCKDEFLKVFSNKEAPTDIPEVTIGTKESKLINLLKTYELVPSVTEAKRLISQGAIKIDGEKIDNSDLFINLKQGESLTIKVGKRRFVKFLG